MVYAVNEINQDPNILPNTTLGLHIYDTCLITRIAIEACLQMMAVQERAILNYQCNRRSPITSIIGELSSTVSMSIATLLGLYRYPQVSHYSTSPLLNNKHEYPSFFRTIPSDDSQAQGLVTIVVHFGWTWVGILANDDDYGRLGSQRLKEEFLKFGVCIAFHENLSTEPSVMKINIITDIIAQSSVNVILAFCSGPNLLPLMRALSQKNISSKVWIASEGWSTSSNFPSNEFGNVMSDTIGLTVHEGTIPGFKEFLLKVHPSNSPKDRFVKLFWEQAMGCHWPRQGSNLTLAKGNSFENTVICTGEEKLQIFKTKFQNEPDARIFYIIYNAVYAVAHALNNMLSCVPGNGSFLFETCGNLGDFKAWQLLHYMKKVRFKNKMEEEISFDRYGNPPAAYDIINWQPGPDGAIHYVKVGTFDTREARGQELQLNRSAFQWTKQGREAPSSFCSESCIPGYHKAVRIGQPVCCFDCIPCSEGEVSKTRDSNKCLPCPGDQWPNEKRSDCVPKRLEVLSYHDPLGATLTATVVLSSFMTMMFLCIFIKYQDTPIVKANNRNLTYVLQGALLISSLCALLFIGEPQSITCLLQHSTFGIVFVVCISCVLAKTLMVVIAFNATKPGSKMRKWLGPWAPIVTVSVCTFIQGLICGSWLLLCPPFPEKNMKLKTGVVILQCNECSQTAFWCMLGYMGLLTCVSFLIAFLARKLPDSFNEAKWITFSMLVFLSVWLSFIPGYLSTKGKYTVAVEVFSIIFSSAGIGICIFLPKSYIILLRPDLNTREQLLGKKASNNKKLKDV
ncbi:extracellular calcium-sensing receptor-like [Pleurodeles waltl]|uniref:extracellular calcium-sensing receptor-like n=1 Tax=Pleurodeles waltl TaxID=8319 RepID=UPI0037093D6F